MDVYNISQDWIAFLTLFNSLERLNELLVNTEGYTKILPVKKEGV